VACAWIAALIGVVLVYVIVLGSPPRRPSNVPGDAVFVEGAKTGWWQSCSHTSQNVTMCRVYNKGGQVIVDEEFLPYDGGPQPTVSELVLDPRNHYSDVYRIALKNGRLLLRKSMFAQSKELLDTFGLTKR
jgi:hypothetical protein